MTGHDGNDTGLEKMKYNPELKKGTYLDGF
jgi:hypothetical protein